MLQESCFVVWGVAYLVNLSDVLEVELETESSAWRHSPLVWVSELSWYTIGVERFCWRKPAVTHVLENFLCQIQQTYSKILLNFKCQNYDVSGKRGAPKTKLLSAKHKYNF